MFGRQRQESRKRSVLQSAFLVLAAVALAGTSTDAGTLLHADAWGGVDHLLQFEARYDGIDATPVAYLAGTLTASLNGGSPFDAYCVDLHDVIYVGGGGTSFNINIRPIQQLSAPGGNGGGVGYLYQTFANTVSTDIDRAALQVAIWKVEYDNGGSLDSGHFTVADSTDLQSTQHLVRSEAAAILVTYNGTQTGYASWLEATSHPFDGTYDLYQNLVGPRFASFRSNVILSTPEPKTLPAVILGVGLVVGLTTRRHLLSRSTLATS